MSYQVKVLQAGRAALRAAGRATVFAAFEKSCYVETAAGIACLGGPGIGMGPLNAIAEDFKPLVVGNSVLIEFEEAKVWKPSAASGPKEIPEIGIPESIAGPAEQFLGWIAGRGKPDDALIGLGPGLTPAGDDFVGGAMIALRTFDCVPLADRIAAWALPLARTNTNRISRAHLECAATGEGHELLHGLLSSLDNERSSEKFLIQLSRVGHSSGLDAAAGALLALEPSYNVNCRHRISIRCGNPARKPCAPGPLERGQPRLDRQS
jgi:hypothetical protein